MDRNTVTYDSETGLPLRPHPRSPGFPVSYHGGQQTMTHDQTAFPRERQERMGPRRTGYVSSKTNPSEYRHSPTLADTRFHRTHNIQDGEYLPEPTRNTSSKQQHKSHHKRSKPKDIVESGGDSASSDSESNGVAIRTVGDKRSVLKRCPGPMCFAMTEASLCKDCEAILKRAYSSSY